MAKKRMTLIDANNIGTLNLNLNRAFKNIAIGAKVIFVTRNKTYHTGVITSKWEGTDPRLVIAEKINGKTKMHYLRDISALSVQIGDNAYVSAAAYGKFTC